MEKMLLTTSQATYV